MAPVIATTTGVPTQTIQDSNLKELLSRLEPYDSSPELNLVPESCEPDLQLPSGNGGVVVAAGSGCSVNGSRRSEKWVVDIEGLVGELERWSEQVSFRVWIFNF